MEKKMREQIAKLCEDNGCTILFMDGYDDAIIGLGTKFHHLSVIYSKKKILDALLKDMDYEDSVEFFEFNIAGAYVGENTPIIIDDTIDYEAILD